MADDRLRWGILGTGMIAGKFAADLPQSRTGELAAVASRSLASAAAFTEKSGGRPVEGYHALLADPEVDAVYISLPNHLHAEWAIAAMEAGKHVLCEKPLACNAAEAETMFDAAKRTNRVLIEAFMYRGSPAVKQVVEMVRNGEIGDLRLIRTNFTFNREVSASDGRYSAGQKGGGGSLMDVGCYCTHFTRALVGKEPVASHAIGHLHAEGNVDDYAAGTLNFGDEILATFTCGMTVTSNQEAFIAGTDGMIRMDAFWFGQKGFTVTRNGQETFHEAPLTQPLYAMEADLFAEAVRGGNAWISPEDTLGNMRVLDELRRSAGMDV